MWPIFRRSQRQLEKWPFLQKRAIWLTTRNLLSVHIGVKSIKNSKLLEQRRFERKYFSSKYVKTVIAIYIESLISPLISFFTDN